MNNTLRTRLLSILFIFGLGIYALLPSIRYQLLSDDAKKSMADIVIKTDDSLKTTNNQVKEFISSLGIKVN